MVLLVSVGRCAPQRNSKTAMLPKMEASSFIRQARISAGRQDWDRALQYYSLAEDYGAEPVLVIKEQMEVSFRAQRYGIAREYTKKFVKLRPEDDRAKLLLARLNWELQEAKKDIGDNSEPGIVPRFKNVGRPKKMKKGKTAIRGMK